MAESLVTLRLPRLFQLLFSSFPRPVAKYQEPLSGLWYQVLDKPTAPGNGQLNLEGTVIVGGLGRNPYRDGSYEYYLSEKVITNDPKGVGALLLAATELERRAARTTGKKRVS